MTGRVNNACLVAAFMLGAGLLLTLVNVRSPVDRGFKDAKLENATTEAEVIALLGPPGDYSTRDYDWVLRSGAFGSGRRVEWKDDHAIVIVYFNHSDKVNRWNKPSLLPPRSSTERLRDFLRELWD